MRFCALFTILIVVLLTACGEKEQASPLQTLQTYQKAVQKKDTTTMKMLLSAETIKSMEQEAKSQGVPLDNIVERDTLFPTTQKAIDFRNQKIEGSKATIEIKNSFGQWETWPFVLEDDQWKIDKKGYADQLMDDIQQQQDQIFQNLDKQTEVPAQPTQQNP